MAIKEMPEKANEISGLMIMAVAGGTVSFAVGAASDMMGITGGVMVILLEVIYLTFCAFRTITKRKAIVTEPNIQQFSFNTK